MGLNPLRSRLPDPPARPGTQREPRIALVVLGENVQVICGRRFGYMDQSEGLLLVLISNFSCRVQLRDACLSIEQIFHRFEDKCSPWPTTAAHSWAMKDRNDS